MNFSLFNDKNEEKAEFNQYWYSPYTISQMVEEVLTLSGKTALVSTPSIYFSIPEESRKNCYLLDFDRAFGTDPRFLFYDFNEPENISSEFHHIFDNVVIDPPFITEEVWRKYGTTAKLLLVPSGGNTLFPSYLIVCSHLTGKAILTTIQENKDLLQELFSATPTAFLPSIPNLVYQYNLYTNYESVTFSKPNPEIPV